MSPRAHTAGQMNDMIQRRSAHARHLQRGRFKGVWATPTTMPTGRFWKVQEPLSLAFLGPHWSYREIKFRLGICFPDLNLKLWRRTFILFNSQEVMTVLVQLLLAQHNFLTCPLRDLYDCVEHPYDIEGVCY